MNRYAALSRFLFRGNSGRQKGYALIVAMVAVTALLISLTAALPSIYQEGQRRREEEAIFRGEQYARAIYLFHRRMGRFPVSVQDLLRTDNIRFLRREYPDPLSRTGRWRFIHASAGGILVDSWNQAAVTEKSSGRPANSSFGGGNNAASSGSGASIFGGNNSAGPGSGSRKGGRKHPKSTCDGPLDQAIGSSTRQTGTLLGAFIVGVAPCNDRQSIRVVEQEDHYDHWEFLGLNYPVYGLPRVTTPGSQQSPQMGFPGLGGTSNGQGMPPANQGLGRSNDQ